MPPDIRAELFEEDHATVVHVDATHRKEKVAVIVEQDARHVPRARTVVFSEQL